MPSGGDTSTANVSKVAAGDYRISTQIDIDAPADAVWSTLTDWDQLDSWSSSFIGLEGDFDAGGHVRVAFKVLGTTQHYEHDLIEFEEGAQFAWSDPFLLGMTDHHVYRVEPIDHTRSRFIQNDRVTGGPARLVGRMTAGMMSRMYQQFNEQLKSRVEQN